MEARIWVKNSLDDITMDSAIAFNFHQYSLRSWKSAWHGDLLTLSLIGSTVSSIASGLVSNTTCRKTSAKALGNGDEIDFVSLDFTRVLDSV